MRDTFWGSGGLFVVMVTTILFQKHMTNNNFQSVYMLALRCRCARNNFNSGGMLVAMVTTYYAKKCRGKSISNELGTYVVDVQEIFLAVAESVLPW